MKLEIWNGSQLTFIKCAFDIFTALTPLMAEWVDIEAQKSRVRRMSVRDYPTWRLIRDYLFVRPHLENQKSIKGTRDLYFVTPSCLPIEP